MTPPWQAAVIGWQIKRKRHPCWDGTALDKKPAGKTTQEMPRRPGRVSKADQSHSPLPDNGRQPPKLLFQILRMPVGNWNRVLCLITHPTQKANGSCHVIM
ncbi:hypothetical protein PspLS_05698 [Pyricularia sp. CBS 133598]|nr:hypothetical protein PspLS_05698 [Pyricularia sp. CBS 133598]